MSGEHTMFETKASTLRWLSTKLTLSRVEPFIIFSHRDWIETAQALLDQIIERFFDDILIVRSSALQEDRLGTSNAGVFSTRLGVKGDSMPEIRAAIEAVLSSYRTKASDNPLNQVLVQKQSLGIEFSGVVLTRTLEGGPYYVISFTLGEDTTAVTGGRLATTVRVLRGTESELDADLAAVLSAIKEIEELIPDVDLDIEFAFNKDKEVVIFQVRQLKVEKRLKKKEIATVQKTVALLEETFCQYSQNKPALAGDTTFFADMPDWNPSEVIGSSPSPFAASLYAYVITDHVWHEARSLQGYLDVRPEKLVVMMANKPYVDVRNSFNSFLPASIPPMLASKLVNGCMSYLRENPQFQDKVEFQVFPTCYDLTFDERLPLFANWGFTTDEILTLKKLLLDLTNSLLDSKIILREIQNNEDLEVFRKAQTCLSRLSQKETLKRAFILLDRCKKDGTLPFAQIARLAFLGKALLKSLVDKKLLSRSGYDSFMSAIQTVATGLKDDSEAVRQGQFSVRDFMHRYGHLRPGTYEITTHRYDHSIPSFLSDEHQSRDLRSVTDKRHFTIIPAQHDLISRELRKHGLRIDSRMLFSYVKLALETREYSKYLFTKCVSDAIELIADVGNSWGFKRSQLSLLDLSTIRMAIQLESTEAMSLWTEVINRNRDDVEIGCRLCLPPVIFSSGDLRVVKHHVPNPNYITRKSVEAPVFVLDAHDFSSSITGKIVILESGDPGYDWIFTQQPVGIITRYGGVASHMAIRCFEFGVPAAIGCGDAIYNMAKRAAKLVLDCEHQRVEIAGSQ